MEQEIVMQVDGTDPISNPDAAALALTGNTMQDLKNVAAELGVTIDQDGNVAQPKRIVTSPVVRAQEARTEAAAPSGEIPAKFQNPDGSANVERIKKSEANVDEMIAKYRAKEREAQTLQNKVNNPPTVVSPQMPQVATNIPLSPLEVQVATDLIKEHAAVGIQLPEAQAIAQARVQVRLQEARYNAELNATADLRQRVEDGERARQLQGAIDADPWLASQEAIDTLWKVRQENPWLNQAPNPWDAAYTFYKGRNGHVSQVLTPTPTGTTAKAPATPVGPVTRVQKTVDITDKKALQGMDLKDLEAQAKKFFPGLRLR